MLIGWLGRAAVQRMLSAAVNRALGGVPRSQGGCVRSPGMFDADELGLDPEEDMCQD